MDSKFLYDIGTRVYFGSGQLSNLGPELKRFGTRVLLTFGGGSIKKTGIYDKVATEVKNAGLQLFEMGGIEPNPRVTTADAGAELCHRENIDVLLAVGGGSTIDCTKAIGAAAVSGGSAWDLVTRKTAVTGCLPIVVVLTMAATGSEMDPIAVISNDLTKEKIGFGAPCLRPRTAFLDPANTFSVSAFQTACGSADILSHLMETYFNTEGDLYMLDRTMEALMKTVIKFAPSAMKHPDDYEARANLMWTSSWAINNFIKGGKNKQVWSCHAMEHQLSAWYDITHGLGLAIITPQWLRYCLDEPRIQKYVDFGVNVFDINAKQAPLDIARQSIRHLSDFFFGDLGLKSTLTEVGIDDSHFDDMARKACKGGVLNGFMPLNQKDIEAIYRMCL